MQLFLLERFRQQGVLVSQPDALETLGEVSVIAFDKTGTLASSRHATVTWGQPCWTNPSHFDSQSDLLGVAFRLAEQSSHPVARAVVQSIIQQGANSQHFHCLSVMEVPGMGISAAVCKKGDPAVYFCRLGSADFCEIKQSSSSQSAVCLSVRVQIDRASEGQAKEDHLLPVATLSGTIVWGETHIEPYTMASLKALGLQCDLLSGDQDLAVRTWAPNLTFDHRFSRLSAQDKARYIERLQSHGKKVLMAGDGMNDVLAFTQADVSLAASDCSAMSAQQADLLMLHKRLELLPDLIQAARFANRLGWENMAWAMGYNIVGMALAVSGVLTPLWASIGMGASSLIVLLNAARLRKAGH